MNLALTTPVASTRSTLMPTVRLALIALALLVTFTHDAAAQTAPEPSPAWEFLVPTGGMIPTGAQRSALDRGALTTAQLLRVVQPALALTATLGWARSHDLASAGDNALDIIGFDLGTELRGTRWALGRGISLRPFAGIGAGARHYDHRHLALDASNKTTAYVSAGGEFGVRRVRVRLEARDYLASARPFAGEHADNDVTLMAGVRWVAR